MADRSGIVPQLLGAAVGIVLGSALLFAVVGMLRDDGPAQPEVVADPSPSATAPAETDDGGEGADPSPSGDEGGEPESPDEGEGEGGDPEPQGSPSPSPTAAPSPEASPEEPPAEEVDPGSISIQVLDAVGGGSGDTAAQAVADELREAGYNVVVVNPAARDYETTTVFWSPGQAAGGQQVAAAIGAGDARETPDEVQLSDSVDVHVVVGADRA